jgi:hypothetical protein
MATAEGERRLARIVAGAHVANSEHWLRADLARIETDGAAPGAPGAAG